MEEKKDSVVDEAATESAEELTAEAVAEDAVEPEGAPAETDGVADADAAVEEAVEEVAEEAAEEAEPEAIAEAKEQDAAEEAELEVAAEAEAADEEAPKASEGEEPADAEPEAVEESPKPSEKKPKGIGDLVIVGILSIIVGVLLALPSAMGITNSEKSESASSAGDVAATVNGIAISESDVTNYVMDFRTKQGLDSNDAWGEWMASYGYTVEDLRTDTIDYFVNRELLKQAIAEQGITVDEADVEKYITSITEQVGGEEAFNEALQAEGLDLDTYREEIRFSLQQQALAEKVAGSDAQVDDAEVLEIVKLYFPDSVDKDAKTLDGVDADTVEQVRSMLASSAMQQAFSQWMEDYRSKVKIVIVDTPENLPYAIDLAPYQQKLEQEQAQAQAQEEEKAKKEEQAKKEEKSKKSESSASAAAEDDADEEETAVSEEKADDEAAADEGSASEGSSEGGSDKS